MHGINVILISLFPEQFPLFLFISRAGPMERPSLSRKQSCKILEDRINFHCRPLQELCDLPGFQEPGMLMILWISVDVDWLLIFRKMYARVHDGFV